MDLETLVEGMERVRKISHASALDDIRGDEVWPDSDDLKAHIRETAQTISHPVGACKMGTDNMAAVDDRL